MWGKGGGVFVVRVCGGIGGPVLEEHVVSAGSEGLVGLIYELRGGDVGSGWWWSVQDEREAGEAFLQG